jgi:tRNA pseudouridine(38-40) synthase
MFRPFVPRGSQFLANIAYSGAKYKGVQRQLRRVDGAPEATTHDAYDSTIQTAIEIGIMDLMPKPVYMHTQIGSRTDAGVNSLDNYLLIRIQHPEYPEQDYNSSDMENAVNSYLFKHDHIIAVKGIRAVGNDFKLGTMAVEYREYAYRFIISPETDLCELDENDFTSRSGHEPLVAPFDQTRIGRVLLGRPIDMKLFESVLMSMDRDHNFRSFECMSPSLISCREREKDAQKLIQKISLNKVNMQTGSVFDQYYKDKDIYEVRIRSKSFLYKQVRRMVGCALMVGSGIIDMDRMKFMMDYGHRWNWLDHYYTAPPDGLYLAKIKWKDSHNFD